MSLDLCGGDLVLFATCRKALKSDHRKHSEINQRALTKPQQSKEIRPLQEINFCIA
jgi:hypothetical protein